MKIVTFFAMLVAAVLIAFVMYYVKTHETAEEIHKLHVFVLSSNEDDFSLKVNSVTFTLEEAEEGDQGTYAYVGTVAKKHDSAYINFKSQNIDTSFHISLPHTDSIAIGVQGNGKLFFKKW